MCINTNLFLRIPFRAPYKTSCILKSKMQHPVTVAIFLLVLLKVHAQSTDKQDCHAHVKFEQNQYFKNLESRITKNEKEIELGLQESGYRDAQGRLNKLTSEVSAISARLDTIVETSLQHLNVLNNLTSNILVTNMGLDKLNTEIQVGQNHSTQLKGVEERVRVLESGMNSINQKLHTEASTRNLLVLISNLTSQMNRIENRIAVIMLTSSSSPSPGIWLLDDKSKDWKRMSGSPCTHGALNIANSTTAVIRWISSVPETCHLLVGFESKTYSYEYTILGSDANCVDSYVSILSIGSLTAKSSGKLCSQGLPLRQVGHSSLLVFHSNSTNAAVDIILKLQAVDTNIRLKTKLFAHILPSDEFTLTVEQFPSLIFTTALITQSGIGRLDGGTGLNWEITKFNLNCKEHEHVNCFDIGGEGRKGLVPSIWWESVCGNSSSIPAVYRTQAGLVCVLYVWQRGSGYAGRISRAPRVTASI